jgi:hypothetical protein
MKIVAIYVTQKDIDGGIRGDSTGCMVSLAMRRRLKITNCQVLTSKITQYTRDLGQVQANLIMKNSKGTPFYGYVPEEVVKRILDYDGKKKVAPFRFSMKVPEVLIKTVRRGPTARAIDKVLEMIELDLVKNPVRFMKKQFEKVLG